MAWRIGAILDIEAQFDWIRAAGFDGVGFHASPGVPGQWQGVDPAATDQAARRRLRGLLSGFAFREVHAPVNRPLRDETLDAAAKDLSAVLDFAGDVGATVVTAHARTPEDAASPNAAAWQETLGRLDAIARQSGVVLGLEVTEGFDWIARQGLRNVGVTLDVGHLYHNGARPLRPFGTLGEVVRRCGRSLAHLHIHDHNGVVDHIELGAGQVDFASLLAALREIAYDGALCLELNPDRCPPEAIVRSLAWLREHIRDTPLE